MFSNVAYLKIIKLLRRIRQGFRLIRNLHGINELHTFLSFLPVETKNRLRHKGLMAVRQRLNRKPTKA